jgi:hypothetical protein
LDCFSAVSRNIKLFCGVDDGFTQAQADNIKTRGAEKLSKKATGEIFPCSFFLNMLSCSSALREEIDLK